MNNSAGSRRIGCCISAHGFGHATRAIAVMEALSQRLDVSFEIVTTVPSWLFSQSLAAPFTVHRMVTDVGLMQQSALTEDLPATVQALDAFYPLAEQRVEQVADLLAGCDLVLCDIAPLGIAAARRAGIPAVLIENFTWDWIYEGYRTRWPQLQPHIATLAALFGQADYHIQTAPVCCPVACDLVINPVARPLRHPERIRHGLRLGPGQKLILVTMGGIGTEAVAIPPLLEHPDLVFALAGRSREDEFSRNLRFLAPDSSWYHPDLIAAADLVVGKIGYSTVAEVYQAGTPFAYVARTGFRESGPLAAFVDSRMVSWNITEEQLQRGEWPTILSPLPVSSHKIRVEATGADQAADYLARLLVQDSSCRTSK